MSHRPRKLRLLARLACEEDEEEEGGGGFRGAFVFLVDQPSRRLLARSREAIRDCISSRGGGGGGGIIISTDSGGGARIDGALSAVPYEKGALSPFFNRYVVGLMKWYTGGL